MNERHHLTFDTYEEGKLSLGQYLDRVVFYQIRSFSRKEFKKYMYAQPKPFQDMIEFVCTLKNQYRLRVAAVSNQGRELTMYRVQQYELGIFIDFFVSSCFVHYRKPDEDMYRIAVDIAQVSSEQVVYIDDRALFVEVARGLGINGIIHTSYEETWKLLEGISFSAATRAQYGKIDEKGKDIFGYGQG